MSTQPEASQQMVRKGMRVAWKGMVISGPRFRDHLETFLIYAALGVFALVVMLPFVNTVARSFSAEGPITRNQVYLWPVKFTLDAYARLVQGGAFWRAYRNSAYITVVGTSIQMLLSTLAAYPLSWRDLPGRGVLMSLIIFQLVFPQGLFPST